MTRLPRTLVPPLTFLALTSCAGDSSNPSSSEPALSASEASPEASTEPTSSSLVGGGGIMAVGSGTMSGTPAAPPAAMPNDGEDTPGTATGAPTSTSPAPTPADSEDPPSNDTAGAPNSPASGAAGTPEPTEGSGGSDSEGAAGGGGQDPPGTGGSGETAPPSFSRPDGVIPNEPQSPSTVGVDQGSWDDGIISPTMEYGHQINQPVVHDGYLLVAGNEEFWVYDVVDPTAPSLLSYFETPNRRVGGEAESHTLSFARYGDNFYLVTIGGTGIDTWDVTDMSAPRHLAKVPIAGTNYGDYTEAVWGVTWQGQYIYVGATNNGIKVVDASDPAAPEVVAEVGTSQYGGVSAGPLEAVGNVLVVMTPKESGGIATLDISDPTSPTRLASFTTQMSYIGNFYRHWAFLITPLRAWDVLSDPSNIGSGSSPIATLNHEGSEYFAFSDDYLFLGHVRTEIGGAPGASKISVSNTAQMRVEERIWGRMDQGGLNDDQFPLPIGNLLVLGDDQAPYHGWFIAVHDTETDVRAPEVDTVIPKPEESGVSTRSRIGITFSDNIELATVNAASFFVRPVGGEPLPGKYGSRLTVLNFDPDEDLEPGTTYEVVLRAGGVTDLVGNALETEWISTFTTE